MDEDLSAEIARIEAELALDTQLRQQQQQQQQPQQQVPPSTFGFSTQLPPQQPSPSGQQQQRSLSAMATPFLPSSSGQASAGSTAASSAAHQFSKDTDGRSIFVGNLPKGENGGPTTTPEELAQFFSDCGRILTCTVLKDRTTQELKGTAYIEFATYTAMGQAIDTKNNANFKGNTIIVTRKRSSVTFQADRARGRGRGRGAALDPYQAIVALMGMMAGGTMHGGYHGVPRGRGRGGRGGSGNSILGGNPSARGGFQPFQ